MRIFKEPIEHVEPIDVFARMIAEGLGFDEARKALGIEARVARKWMTSEGWRERVRRWAVSKQNVEDEITSMIPKAVELKRNILTNPEASLKLRNEVASELIRMKGWDKLYDEHVEVFEFSADFTDQIKSSRVAARRETKRVASQ
jgi:hypothetical protein